jgi:NADH:ubiquinone oxidoreductase subunit K
MLKEQVLNSLSFPKSKSISARLMAICLILTSFLYGIIAILETVAILEQQLFAVFVILSCITGSLFTFEYFDGNISKVLQG